MKIQYIIHADFELPGALHTWAKKNSYEESICRPFAGERLPSPSDFDLLILMGGPQCAVRLDEPYLKQEVALIQQTETPILGFCLGAQLIGAALGAPAEHSPHKEIGVFPIHITEEGKQDPLLAGLPATFPVIHWHSDMPGLTPEAKVLAYSEGCPRQIIRYTPRIYGFQCHPEPTRENIEAMIKHCPKDFMPNQYVQTPQQLLAADYAAINQTLFSVMDQVGLLETQTI